MHEHHADHSHRLSVAVMVAAVLVALQPGQATQLTWSNSGGGLAGVATNWNPQQVPAAGDDLIFHVPNTYSITFGAAVVTTRMHTYKHGDVTLNYSSPHTVTNSLTVSNLPGEDSIVTLASGTLNSNGNVTVGHLTGASGRLIVNGSTSFLNITNGSDLILGDAGQGVVIVSGLGRVVVADQLLAGINSTQNNAIRITGSLGTPPFGASQLTVNGLGESHIAQDGVGSLQVDTGAVATFAGSLLLGSGLDSHGSASVGTAGLLDARLQVNGDLLIGRNSTGAPAGTGYFSIGTGGAVTVAGATRLGDPDGGIGYLVMAGGTINGTMPISVLNGSKIQGQGTINANITNSGTVMPQDPNGLTINGILSSTVSNQIMGTRIAFGNGGGFTGAGTIRTNLDARPGSTITLTGPLTVTSTDSDGFQVNGLTNIGGQTLSVIDTSSARFIGETNLGGGTINVSSQFVVNGVLRGTGQLNVPTFRSNSGSVIDPEPTTVGGGFIEINGNATLNSDFAIGIGQPMFLEIDRLSVNGSVSILGGRVLLSIKNGFIPHVGDQYAIIGATNVITGHFDSLIQPSGNNAPCNGVQFSLAYTSDTVFVVVQPPAACSALGDLNGDGFVTGRDIQPFLHAILTGPYRTCADMNGNCSDDVLDISPFVSRLLQAS